MEAIGGGRTPGRTIEFIMEGVLHNTHKSGALLGARGIFVVVATYALDHGWPWGAALAAMPLLLAGSLLLITTLKSTAQIFLDAPSEQSFLAVNVLAGRVVRFNLALHLTFVAVILLVLDAFTLIRMPRTSYHAWFDLKPGVKDAEPARDVSRYMNYLKSNGLIADWRLTRRKLGLGPRELGEFNPVMQTRDLAQLDAAFGHVATRRQPVAGVHFAVS